MDLSTLVASEHWFSSNTEEKVKPLSKLKVILQHPVVVMVVAVQTLPTTSV